MTNYLELFGLVSTGVGVAFGFGRQSAAIATLRKDTDANHRQHRDILTSLNEIEKKLTRMEERIDFLRDR
jgi:hypothetical protein